jgi:hypothetical protein
MTCWPIVVTHRYFRGGSASNDILEILEEEVHQMIFKKSGHFAPRH